jgi:hypothetical protein
MEAAIMGRPMRTAGRRVDVAEWLEWCIGCWIDPKNALDDLDARR